ncbi:DUF3291 domain-containing protein [Chondrinema litorale]|uniref:DUF3291 domain-containing protein n=1 Tax=Chondrinema litorale TaxID=2994555 RepID=UPI0025433958|nr:DUF3291 domain-containing protein [Chondrinema litorale]UZR93818.1 DUF3291 domain-containing protein [Chondrinema litorale]
MKVTITSIELKGPLKFFALSAEALQILKQLKASHCKAFKKRGIWTMHYTMTLWNDESELKTFAKSGAHLEAMHKSKSIAKEIRTITLDMDSLPDWNTAKQLLKDANVLRF